jgi:hypothetical protein
MKKSMLFLAVLVALFGLTVSGCGGCCDGGGSGSNSGYYR